MRADLSDMGAACVTGATGCIGSALLARLGGWEVRALVRAQSAELASVDMRRGDVFDPPFVERALEGTDVLIHLAALARPRPTCPWPELYHTNVEMTRRLWLAARAAGLRRFVFVSSDEAIGPAPPGGALSEDTPCMPTTAYGRSKLLAEQTLFELAAAGPPELVVVRPCVVYGEHDRGTTALLVRALAGGRFVLPSAGRARRSICYAGNLAEALLLAASRPAAAGRVYLIADQAVPVRELVEVIVHAIASCSGRRPALPPRFPLAPLRVAAIAGDIAGRLGFQAPLSTPRLAALTTDRVLDTTRAAHELGYVPPHPLQAAMRATVCTLLLERGLEGHQLDRPIAKSDA